MRKARTGAIAALFVAASVARADDPPAASVPPPPIDAEGRGAMHLVHREMHEAMLKHAPSPHLASLPDHAAVQAGTEHANAQAHHRAAAEQMAQRHAAEQRDRHRNQDRDPGHRDAHGGTDGTGMMGGGTQGEPGSCDGAAEHMQNMGRHGGPGGMDGGDHGDQGGMTPGTGAGPHGDGQMDGMR